MPDEILLNEAAYAVWQTVKDHGPIELGEVVKLTGIDQAQVSAAASEAAKRGFFEISERKKSVYVLDDSYQPIGSPRLPEQLAAKELIEHGEKTMADFAKWSSAAGIAVNEAIKWGEARGWLEKKKTASGITVCATPAAQEASRGNFTDDDIRALNDLAARGREGVIEHPRAAELLAKRPELAKKKDRTDRTLRITDAGNRVLASGGVKLIKERNTLTPEDLESGAWREIKLRPYDVTLAAKDVYPAKIHPLRKIIEQTRRAFLEMGFTEVVSPMVESAFWNFDALFQPQDHPARDMQDTFYMREPAEAPLPGKKGGEKGVRNLFPERPEASLAKKVPDTFFAPAEIVEHVRQTHENGWTTGSEGWGYTWSPERSKQVVLRTHTTAATIRALAANPHPPGKFFCVGWTYRNETISFKHLPVFHQVDGIIVDEEANLASLMGTLQEFYSKMGFGRVKFKPAFYPYTEPSVDVVVYMESRKKWLEMGGAGIFRPEVTLPLGCSYPVLAWGLGIERLAMLRFGLSDIRDLYRASLDALEEVPLCR
ncbi:MAG: phenylalanine--tRNA ligase subunit alpha [Pirellulales bacterium]